MGIREPCMIIDSANLRFVTSSASREQETSNTRASADITPSAGNVVAIGASYSQKENVLLNSSQSGYLYSRSQISRADQPKAVEVYSREEALQSLVSHAFSRSVSVSGVIPLSHSTTGGNVTIPGRNLATQARVSLSQSYHYQSEQHSTLTIEGQLTLADSRSVDFVVHTRMDSSLDFRSGSGEFAQTAVRTDPLILNLHGGAAQLTDAAFAFDINGDGTWENVSLATGGSGFIAFDRNGDGRINDGSELFGSSSGDGFADLAAYDQDGNGFIDANDPIFSQLKFWSRDENDTDHLQSLQDVGVAAIGLESADSPFRIRGSGAQELGTVHSTGIFLTENGEVGTVQQVDLANRDLVEEHRFAADFGNAQIAAPAEEAAAPSPQRQQLDQLMQRLQQIRDDFMARLDSRKDADRKEGSKSLLQLLVDKLEDYIRKQHDGDNENRN